MSQGKPRTSVSLAHRKQDARGVALQLNSSKIRTGKCLILICAYNEEKGLRCLLESLKGREVLVVDDGSQDKTNEIANIFGATVLTHDSRLGKAAALVDGISYALQYSYETIIEIGADAIPEPGAIEELLRILRSSGVGAVSGRQIPVGRNHMAFHIDELIWSLLAKAKEVQMYRLGSSHLGAVMYAYKPALVDSVMGSVNDDEQVGISIQKKGYRTCFAKDAVVRFDASSSIGHIVERRKRMYYGHFKFSVSTAPSMQACTSALALFASLIERPRRFIWVIPTFFLDFYSRLIAWRDARDPKKKQEYTRWVTTYMKDRSLIIRRSSQR